MVWRVLLSVIVVLLAVGLSNVAGTIPMMILGGIAVIAIWITGRKKT